MRLKRAEMHLKEILKITDREIGDEFEISPSTFNDWKKGPKKHLYEILTKVYIVQLHKVEDEADLLEIKKFIQKKIKKAKK
jgi:hypothetical protein